MNRQRDIEPYWQDEDDWLCAVDLTILRTSHPCHRRSSPPMQARSAHERWCSRDESSTIVVAVNAQLLRQLKLQQLQRPPSKRKNLLRSKIQLRSRAVMNAAFTKELVALMPTCMLLCVPCSVDSSKLGAALHQLRLSAVIIRRREGRKQRLTTPFSTTAAHRFLQRTTNCLRFDND